ncbi:MAG: HAMP domain-containing histidine kinase [Ktedonobacteraceae bacterium]|nr:HAMP domain-containing histidine kinase [Ktedonobacteraceae bacterium]
MLTLPYPVRLGGTIVCVLLGLVIHLITFPFTHSGNILALPIALIAWLFKKRGFLIGYTIILLTVMFYHTLSLGTWLWPPSLTIYFSSGFLILFIEGFILISLRNLLDSADAARNRSQEAEKRIEVAYEQQYQLNQIKDQFLINMNHELRTPLTELHAYLELLHERHEQLNSNVRTRYIEHAFQASKELQQLTYNVLDAMQIEEQGKTLIAEEFPLARQIDDLVNHLNADKRQNYTIQSNIPADLTVFANAQAVRQILHNLLSNVFKYTPPQTRIIIEAEETILQETGKEYVRVCVQDEGPGIPPDEIPLLFKQFVRLKRDISGPIRGTGLGLYICRKLVEAMGGSIWVESDGIPGPGHGSRFCFILPSTKHTP